ncbi:hypothetical protein AMECASPLE_020350 [Ameca splendens]|uniref:Uncharacterized protein n=1 Tax=Ameca splendens TaxID=208324 RepID=A0ABV0YQJ8_9TELE
MWHFNAHRGFWCKCLPSFDPRPVRSPTDPALTPTAHPNLQQVHSPPPVLSQLRAGTTLKLSKHPASHTPSVHTPSQSSSKYTHTQQKQPLCSPSTAPSRSELQWVFHTYPSSLWN